MMNKKGREKKKEGRRRKKWDKDKGRGRWECLINLGTRGGRRVGGRKDKEKRRIKGKKGIEEQEGKREPRGRDKDQRRGSLECLINPGTRGGREVGGTEDKGKNRGKGVEGNRRTRREERTKRKR